MLAILRENLNRSKSRDSFEGFVLDNCLRDPIRQVILAECGAPELLHENDDWIDGDINVLINNLPESDLDDADAIMNGIIHARDSQGDDVDYTIDECCEHYIPESEER